MNTLSHVRPLPLYARAPSGSICSLLSRGIPVLSVFGAWKFHCASSVNTYPRPSTATWTRRKRPKAARCCKYAHERLTAVARISCKPEGRGSYVRAVINDKPCSMVWATRIPCMGYEESQERKQNSQQGPYQCRHGASSASFQRSVSFELDTGIVYDKAY